MAWMNTLAIQNYDCPHCGALRTKSCKTPKGRKTTVHSERIACLTKAEKEQCVGKASRPSFLKSE